MTEVVNQKNTSEFDVYIGRGQTREDNMNTVEVGEYGWISNPYPEDEYGREECIRLFAVDFYQRISNDNEFRNAVLDLHGKTLGCWCKPDACHGDIIRNYVDEIANEDDRDTQSLLDL